MRSAGGERMVGRYYEAAELASILNGQADVLAPAGGGVTFSGGEPLMQAGFVAEVIDLLEGTHVVLDTSGYALGEFADVAGRCDLVFFDIKLVDAEAHRRWTGQDNGPILRNLASLETRRRRSWRGSRWSRASPTRPGTSRPSPGCWRRRQPWSR